MEISRKQRWKSEVVRYPLTQQQGEEEEIEAREVAVLFPRLILFFTKKRTSETRERERGVRKGRREERRVKDGGKQAAIHFQIWVTSLRR